MGKLIRIREVRPLTDFQVEVSFTDGTERVIDLARYLHGPVFNAVREDPKVFRSLSVDPELGTIVWPNGADIDPDVLYQGLAPAWEQAESGRK